MLWKWREAQKNYKNSGYDVVAISPSFPATNPGWWDRTKTDPYWGKGTGQLQVDYIKTSKDFWNIVKEKKPIAIMSFSRGANDKSWELEAKARNLPQTSWIHGDLPWFDNAGTQHITHWDMPIAGGANNDFSPYKGQGTIANKPPDRSQPANNFRTNNLPLTAIKNAINGQFPDPPGNIVAAIDPSGDVGGFVSEYMAYHVGWYRDYINAQNNPATKCEASGHTHVGTKVAVPDAEKAVEIQLDELIKILP